MVLKSAKWDLNGVKMAIFDAKSQKSPNSWRLCPLCDTLELQRFVQQGPKSDNFCAKNIYFWFEPPLSQQKPGSVSGCIYSCRQIF